MKFLPESTRIFPKFNVISLADSKKLLKFIKDGGHIDLIWIGLGIEYLLGCMNEVGDDNDLEMFSLLQAWLIPHLIAKSSASVLVTKTM